MWDFIDLDDIYIGYIGVIGDDWGYLKGMVWFSFRCKIGKEVDWLEFREWFESDGWNWKFGNCR